MTYITLSTNKKIQSWFLNLINATGKLASFTLLTAANAQRIIFTCTKDGCTEDLSFYKELAQPQTWSQLLTSKETAATLICIIGFTAAILYCKYGNIEPNRPTTYFIYNKDDRSEHVKQLEISEKNHSKS